MGRSNLNPETLVEAKLDELLGEIEDEMDGDAVTFCGPITYGVEEHIRNEVEAITPKRPSERLIVILRRVDARDAIFCGEMPCAAAPTESILLEVERKLLLRGLFARIGSRCRDILHRYYLIGESTSTIAGAMNFKPMTVLICLSKCRKRALEAYRSMTERPPT
jgi:hypothetical protein